MIMAPRSANARHLAFARPDAAAEPDLQHPPPIPRDPQWISALGATEIHCGRAVRKRRRLEGAAGELLPQGGERLVRCQGADVLLRGVRGARGV